MDLRTYDKPIREKTRFVGKAFLWYLKTMKARYLIISIFLVFLFSSCATTPKEKKAYLKPDIETTKIISPEEREKKAFLKFNEILIARRSAKDRKSALPRMEKLYIELINEYPDVPVAQESYWKLIEIYVKDYSPPLYDKAEALYGKFLKKYSHSGLRELVDKTLGISFYRNKEWERLLRLSTPEFMEYNRGGKAPFPFLIFMYAEANFRMGNFDEAEKGFKIVLEKFPQLKEEKKAKARIAEIKRRNR